MASIKKLNTRKFKITVSKGYRPDGRKISRAKTITVPQTVGGRGARALDSARRGVVAVACTARKELRTVGGAACKTCVHNLFVRLGRGGRAYTVQRFYAACGRQSYSRTDGGRCGYCALGVVRRAVYVGLRHL